MKGKEKRKYMIINLQFTENDIKDKLKILVELFVKKNNKILRIIFNNKESKPLFSININKEDKKKGFKKIILKLYDNLISLHSMFYGCASLISVSDISDLETKMIKSISRLFYGCRKIANLPDISNWNTFNVTDIS